MSYHQEAMNKIFNPGTIAFVGASNSMDKWGGIIFRNLVEGGYEGTIYPVNPREREIQGYKAYATVSSIPGEVDLAVFTIPAGLVPGAVTECVHKGVKAGVVISAGFAELGADGRCLQHDMVRRARAGGMVLVGPNGQGIAVPKLKLYPWIPAFKPDDGPIGIASQSGGVATALSEQLAEFAFGCSKVVSVGNCADLGWTEYLEYFSLDEDTKVIVLYVEGLDDGRRFFNAARDAARRKPIVMLKSGKTPVGSRAAASHTGVLAGSDRILDAACRQSGITRVETMEDAVSIAATFVATPLPADRRVGIITGGGGYGVIAADATARAGLDLVRLSEDTIEKIRVHLPPWWSPNNPVDLVAGLRYGGPLDLIPILMESGEVGGVIVLGIGWVYTMSDPVNATVDLLRPENAPLLARMEDDIDACRQFAQYRRTWNKPLLMTSHVARLAVRRKYTGLLNLLQQQVMLYPTSEDAIKAYAALADRYDFLQREQASRSARSEPKAETVRN